MPPITWRNIDAPDFTGAANIMKQGNESLQQGVAGLQRLAAGVRDNQIANVDTQAQRTTDQLLQTIRGARTMDQQQALLQQLDPEVLRQRYGAGVDINAVQRGLSDQVQTIRTNEANDFKYGQDLQVRADAPKLQAFDRQLAEAKTSDQILNTPLPTDLNDVTAARSRLGEAYTQLRNREKIQLADNLDARTTQLQNLGTQAITTAQDPADVVRTLQAGGAKLNLPPQVIAAATENALTNLKTASTPSEAQKGEVGQFFGNYNASLTAEEQAIQRAKDESKRRNPATAEYSQMGEVERNMTQGDALKLLPGWDNNKTSWWDNPSAATGEQLRNDYVLPELRKFEKETGQATPGWMIAKAAKITGEANAYSFQQETNPTAFMENLRAVYKQYQQEQDGITKDQTTTAIRETLLNEAKQRQISAQQETGRLLEQLNRARVQGNTSQQKNLEARLRELSQGFQQPYQYNPQANKK